MTPGPDGSVVAFQRDPHLCFGSAAASGPARRTVDTQVTFPTTGTFSQIIMNVTLHCPSNGCDPWDRVGSIDLVTPSGPADAGVETLTELGRFITPYNIAPPTNSPPRGIST